MKINKKIVKNKKRNKKKNKKIIKNNVDVVSEKISIILEADLKYIKHITQVLGPKVALKLCNQTDDVESSGGLTDPDLPSKKLTKLESFIYLIENDSSVSDNKKNSIQSQSYLASGDSSTIPPKLAKKKRKLINKKVNGIQGELDKLCLTQVKNQIKEQTKSNYFAFGALSSFGSPTNSTNNFGSPISSNKSYIKPSTFNLNLNDGLRITKNYSNDLIRRPKLNLDQMNFNGSSVMKSGFQTSNDQPNVQPQLNQTNYETINQTTQNNQTNIYQINNSRSLNIQVNLSINNIKTECPNVLTPHLYTPLSNTSDFASISNAPNSSTALTSSNTSVQGLLSNASFLLNN